MARYKGPKNRLARREGSDLELKTPGSKSHASLLRRLNIPPGQHGPKGSRRKPSDYSFQLREKQKAKRYYGVLEKQFKKYYSRAIKIKGNTGEALILIALE
jgi:small subunit ribosomal protein S4